jgi:hypothetical protein
MSVYITGPLSAVGRQKEDVAAVFAKNQKMVKSFGLNVSTFLLSLQSLVNLLSYK